MDLCSGHHVGIFCIMWTAMMPDYGIGVLCVGNRNGSNIFRQEYQYEKLLGYVQQYSMVMNSIDCMVANRFNRDHIT